MSNLKLWNWKFGCEFSSLYFLVITKEEQFIGDRKKERNAFHVVAKIFIIGTLSDTCLCCGVYRKKYNKNSSSTMKFSHQLSNSFHLKLLKKFRILWADDDERSLRNKVSKYVYVYTLRFGALFLYLLLTNLLSLLTLITAALFLKREMYGYTVWSKKMWTPILFLKAT
jgi:hypothetical protein